MTVTQRQNNLLKELSEELDFKENEDKDIKIAVGELLNDKKYSQLGNLNDTQMEIISRLIIHNELRMKSFPDIYKKNNKTIKELLNVSKSYKGFAFTGIVDMFRIIINKKEEHLNFPSK